MTDNTMAKRKKNEKDEQYLQNVHKENNRLGKTNPTKNSDAPEVWAITSLLVAPVELLLNETKIIGYGNCFGY